MRQLLTIFTALLLVGIPWQTPAQAQDPGGEAAPVTTLVTGDQVLWPAGDGPSAALVRPAGRDAAGSTFTHLQAGSQRYVFPNSAAPYLFRQLDPALFTVPEAGAEDRLPVRVTYRSGTADVPGMTVTGQDASGADGYIDAAGAGEFGRALARQYAADAKTGRFGQDGLFSRVASITAAGGSRAAAPVAPAYQMRTLTLRVLDHAGKPLDQGLIAVANVDDTRKFGVIGQVWKGVAKFSVPAGTYTLTTQAFRHTDAAQQRSESRFVTIPQLKVSKDQSATVDLRKATVPVTAGVTQGQVKPVLTTFRYARFDATGAQAVLWDWSGDSGTSFLVSPTEAPAVGTERYYSRWSLSGTNSEGAESHYDLKFPSDHVPAAQTHRVTESELGRIDVAYPSEVGERLSIDGKTGVLPWEHDLPIFDYFREITAPTERVEYVTARPDVHWRNAFVTDAGTMGGVMVDAWRTHEPGERSEVVWGGHPQHPSVEIDTGVHPVFAPAVTRSGDRMNLFLFPFGDPTVGHAGARSPGLGEDLREDIKFTLHAGDTQVAEGGYPYVQNLPVPPEDTEYRITLDTERVAPWFKLSNTIHTEWTFRSRNVPSGAALPDPDWTCVRFEPSKDCAAYPILLLYYQVDGLDLTNTAKPGPASTRIEVYHAQGAAPSPVTAVTLDVSFDGGTTWQQAQVSGEGDSYVARYTHPDPGSAGGRVTLRATAEDAAGNTITQTISPAYALAG